MLNCFKVFGDSMLPSLHAGDYVVTTNILRLKIDDMVVLEHPVFKKIIKRVISLSSKDYVKLSSDNSKGLSMERLGKIKRDRIIGKVLFRISNN